jgi:hypothetical protein
MTRPHISLVSPAVPDSPDAWLRTAVAERDGGVIVHVAASAEDLPRLATVIEAIDDRDAFEQLVLDVGAGPAADHILAELGVSVPVLRQSSPPQLPDDVHGVLEASGCTAVVVHVDDHAGLCCALAAARLGISVVRVGGLPSTGPGRVIARIADVVLTRAPLGDPARPMPIAPERVYVVGNPLVDLVQRHARSALTAAAWRHYDVAPGGYVLVALAGNVAFAEIRSALSVLAGQVPLILEAPAGYDVPGARVVTRPSFLERLSLERAAKAIFTDSPRVHEEAAVLGVPCGAVNTAVDTNGLGRADDNLGFRESVSAWDRQAGVRAADAFVANFARVRLPL